MLSFPRKVKHRKWQTSRINPKKPKVESRGITVAFGSFGLKAQTPGRVRSNQIEAARKTLTRTLSKAGKVWIRIFTDRPFTHKAAQMPMGKGKGEPEGYCFEVFPGRVLFEVDGVTEAVAKEALRKAGAKLPIKTKVVAHV
ncbi:MAG: 50S ribosomal protein L16 [Candidatus Parcubacteria bacterium]|nr:50S ribosomal protein L16 [Candidatus Parcubacteria bacterium]